jgi:hypothetical protein
LRRSGLERLEASGDGVDLLGEVWANGDSGVSRDAVELGRSLVLDGARVVV